jgi:hypothetical protein
VASEANQVFADVGRQKIRAIVSSTHAFSETSRNSTDLEPLPECLKIGNAQRALWPYGS